jgi:toxin ParE1/3/4
VVEVRWTLQAADDVEAIAAFIATDSTTYAQLFVLNVMQGVDRISRFPRVGRMVPEFGQAILRELILGNYRLVYRIRKDVVEILTVFHGARRLHLDEAG